jgi:hypothetical protein
MAYTTSRQSAFFRRTTYTSRIPAALPPYTIIITRTHPKILCAFRNNNNNTIGIGLPPRDIDDNIIPLICIYLPARARRIYMRNDAMLTDSLSRALSRLPLYGFFFFKRRKKAVPYSCSRCSSNAFRFYRWVHATIRHCIFPFLKTSVNNMIYY